MKNIVLRHDCANVTCINCGCTDESPCLNSSGNPCHWLRRSNTLGIGLCSECRKLLPEWLGLLKRRFNELDAERRKRYRPGQAKRTCLKCNREFLSEGKFNRTCGPCRAANANQVTINANARIDVPDVPAVRGWGGRMG